MSKAQMQADMVFDGANRSIPAVTGFRCEDATGSFIEGASYTSTDGIPGATRDNYVSPFTLTTTPTLLNPPFGAVMLIARGSGLWRFGTNSFLTGGLGKSYKLVDALINFAIPTGADASNWNPPPGSGKTYMIPQMWVCADQATGVSITFDFCYGLLTP